MPEAQPAREYGPQYGPPAEAAGGAEQDGDRAPESAAAGAAAGRTDAAGPAEHAPQAAPDGEAAPVAEAAPQEGAQAGPAQGPGDDAAVEENEQHDPEDDAPRPLGLHVEPTGDSAVDAGLKRLEDADRLAVSGHLEVYEDVHRGLREALSALDRQAPAPGPTPDSGPAPGPGRAPGSAPASPHGPGRPVPGPAHPRS